MSVAAPKCVLVRPTHGSTVHHHAHDRNARHAHGSTLDCNNFPHAPAGPLVRPTHGSTVHDHAHGTHNVQRWIPTIFHVRWCSKGGLGNPNARWHPHDEFDTTRYRAPGHANTPPPPNIQQNFDRVPESAVLDNRIPSHFHEMAPKSTKLCNMVAVREATTELDAARQEHGRNARVHVCTSNPTKQRHKIKGHRTRDAIAPLNTRVHDAHVRNAPQVQCPTTDSNNFPGALVHQNACRYDQRTVAQCTTTPTDVTHGTSKDQRWIPKISHARWCSKGGLGTTNAR